MSMHGQCELSQNCHTLLMLHRNACTYMLPVLAEQTNVPFPEVFGPSAVDNTGGTTQESVGFMAVHTAHKCSYRSCMRRELMTGL